MISTAKFVSKRILGFYGLLILWMLSIAAVAVAADAGKQTYAERFAQAQKLDRDGDEAKAIHIYQALIKAFPERPQAYNNLAAIKARHGQYQQAQALLEKALRNNPVYATVYENLSAIYVEMARDSYGKALKLETPQKHLVLKALSEPVAKVKKPQQLASAEQVNKQASKVEAESSLAESAQNEAANMQKQEKTAAEVEVKSAVPESADKNTTPAEKSSSPSSGVDTDNQAQHPVVIIATQKPSATSERNVVDPPLLPFNKDEVISNLQGWAAAWSEKAVNLYASFYTSDYAPEGMTHTQWLQQRRQRIQAPKTIEVRLSDIEVDVIKDDEARVRLNQVYQSPRYRDKTRKEFRLIHKHDGWRIVEEKTIAKLH